MGVLINQMGRILSRCVHISDHQDVPFKHLTILFINYTLIRLNILKNLMA